MSYNLECQKCSREWEYNGDSEYYATCPNCKTSVKISNSKEKSPEERDNQ